MKKSCYCFACEEEFSVISGQTLPITHCPFCGSELNDEDADVADD